MADEDQAETAGPEAIEYPGQVVVSRWIHNDCALVIFSGDLEDLFAAWRQHASLWDATSDGLSEVLMRQVLGAATLHLMNRPRDETVAWTLNLQRPPTNLFLAGDARDGRSREGSLSKGSARRARVASSCRRSGRADRRH